MSLIPRIEFPEIVIGLVAPIGTPLEETIAELSDFFKSNSYQVHDVRVTDVFKRLQRIVVPERKLVSKPMEERYETHIAYGNQLRRFASDSSVLAALTIQTIVERRIKESNKYNERFTRNVYIVHQFKRPEETDLMRAVYGKIFFQVSVYSMRSSRVDYLARKFAEDAGDASHTSHRAAAERLIDIDENQAREKFGQRVGKIFHDADFILNHDVRAPNISSQCKRFLELLFSSNTITPTKIEYGMFAAKSAALRTSDLSRQVGAAVFSKKGEVVSLGSNEVPKAGGGTYWPDEEFDDREFKRGVDSYVVFLMPTLWAFQSAMNLNLWCKPEVSDANRNFIAARF